MAPPPQQDIDMDEDFEEFDVEFEVDLPDANTDFTKLDDFDSDFAVLDGVAAKATGQQQKQKHPKPKPLKTGNENRSSSGNLSKGSARHDTGDNEGESNVTVESLGVPDRAGWLSKYSGPLSAKKAWKRRYFVLKGSNLHFFASPSTTAVGVLRLQGAKIDSADQETSKGNSLQILKTPNKQYYFIAESEEDKTLWLRDLYLASIPPTDDFSRLGTVVGSRAKSSKKDKKTQELDIAVKKEPGMSLGLDIRVQVNEGTLVTNILPNGAAIRSAQFRIGDCIIKINGVNIQSLSAEDVISKLRSLTGDIKFTVTRPINN